MDNDKTVIFVPPGPASAFTLQSDYERGRQEGIREGMERAAGICEDRVKDCTSGCCKWTAKEIRSAKEKL